MSEHEFDRVLDGDDLGLAGVVDLFDHRRECRRFAHSGRAGDEHVAALQARHLAQRAREIELLEGADLQRNDPQHDVVEASLTRDVDAEAALARQFECEVELVEVVESFVVGFGEDPRDRFGVLFSQDLVAEFDEIAVESIEG